MRWTVFLVAACLFVAMDNSLLHSLQIGRPPSAALWPSSAACLAVFICLFAPRATALWACWTLGLLVDLTGPFPTASGSTIRLIGPAALGYTVGALLVLRFRTTVFRRRALSIGVLTCAFLLAVNLVQLAVMAIQSSYAGGPMHGTLPPASGELIRRSLSALYSGVIAVPIGWLLLMSMPLWGFQAMPGARAWR